MVAAYVPFYKEIDECNARARKNPYHDG